MQISKFFWLFFRFRFFLEFEYPYDIPIINKDQTNQYIPVDAQFFFYLDSKKAISFS